MVALAPASARSSALPLCTLAGLAGLGWLSARLGGAPAGRAVLRITLWGVAAMSCSALIGHLAGITV